MQSHIHNCHGAVPAVFNFMPGKGNASSQAQVSAPVLLSCLTEKENRVCCCTQGLDFFFFLKEGEKKMTSADSMPMFSRLYPSFPTVLLLKLWFMACGSQAFDTAEAEIQAEKLY